MNWLTNKNTLNYHRNFGAGIYSGCLLLILMLLVGCGDSGSSSDSGSSDSGSSDSGSSGSQVTLTWQSPTKNTDGSPIDNLAGHVIYNSTTSGVYDSNDIIENYPTINQAGGVTETYTIDDLAPGTHYFQITAYNAAGTQSTPSIEVQKTIK